MKIRSLVWTEELFSRHSARNANTAIGAGALEQLSYVRIH